MKNLSRGHVQTMCTEFGAIFWLLPPCGHFYLIGNCYGFLSISLPLICPSGMYANWFCIIFILSIPYGPPEIDILQYKIQHGFIRKKENFRREWHVFCKMPKLYKTFVVVLLTPLRSPLYFGLKTFQKSRDFQMWYFFEKVSAGTITIVASLSANF